MKRASLTLRNFLSLLHNLSTGVKPVSEVQMKKIIKQKIDPAFMPIPISAIQIDKAITFDCYIKRFNDYVIIIEAGTVITSDLYESLSTNKSIYIRHEEYSNYKTYSQESAVDKTYAVERVVQPDRQESKRMSMEEAVQNCLSLPKNVEQNICLQEKMLHIYDAATDLMRTYGEGNSVMLPMKAITVYIDMIINLLIKKGTLFDYLSILSPDEYSFETHAVNVSILSAMLGYELELSKPELRTLILAALLQDIGKKKIPNKILEKEGPLKEHEFEAVRKHPELSVEILKENNIKDAMIISAIKYHHERLDGSGYPFGLKGHTIPKYAQIIGLCDVFDALTTERTFRAKFSSFDALVMMKRKMVNEFNQEYVDTLIRIQKKK